jgi:hypothetical protein
MNFKIILVAMISVMLLAGCSQQQGMKSPEEKTDEDTPPTGPQNESQVMPKNDTTVAGEIIPLKEAKLIIEHNAKDEDTGFQGFIDSEGWSELTVTGPDGAVLTFKGQGKLGELGLTELFFETVEPENADVSIPDMLKILPEGEYVIKGTAMEAGERKGTTIGTALLTHNIPEGPVLTSPAEGVSVPIDEDLVVSWNPVTQTIDGKSVNIISYQLIIEKDEPPHPNMIGKRGLSMYLPASVTKITISKEFLEANTDYDWEVLAIEESGNQALNSSYFDTYD